MTDDAVAKFLGIEGALPGEDMKPEKKPALHCHDCGGAIHVGDWAMIQYTDGKGTVYCGPCAQARYGEDIVHREGPLQPDPVH